MFWVPNMIANIVNHKNMYRTHRIKAKNTKKSHNTALLLGKFDLSIHTNKIID